MSRNSLWYAALLLCGILFLAGRPAPADDKDKPSLSGTWDKKDGEPQLIFTSKDELKIYPHGDKFDFEIGCSYTVSKDGLVKAKITRLDGKKEVVEHAKATVPIGLEFKFKWKVKDEAATLEDLEGKDVEQVKQRLEGDYTKKS